MNLTMICGSIADSIKTWFQGWFGAILSFIPKIAYQLLTALFAITDTLQWLMRKFAGLDVVSYSASTSTLNSANAINGDIVEFFIQNILIGKDGATPVLSNVFWSLMILGVIILFLTTLIAVIRSEYTATDSKSASKGRIIGNALKGLASFIIVPVVCFFGIYLGNIILQALDTITSGSNPTYTYSYVDESGNKVTASNMYATSETTDGKETYYNYSIFGVKIPTSSTPISGLIFRASAYKANRTRTDSGFYNQIKSNSGVNLGIFDKSSSSENSANMIDDAFSNTYKLTEKKKVDISPFKGGHMFPVNLSVTFTVAEHVITTQGFSYFDKNNTTLVWFYYDLWSFDFIICIAAGITIVTLLMYLIFGLIKRIFELIILFMISAPISALMPLDNGSALKKWREKFVAKAIGTYGPIIGLNLFFLVLTALSSINFTNVAIVNTLIILLLTVAGLSMVRDFCGMLSELIGSDDSLKAGADKAEDIGKTVKKVGSVAAGGAFLAGKIAFASTGAGALVKTGKAIEGIRRRSNAKSQVNRYSKNSEGFQRAKNQMMSQVSDMDAVNEIGANIISDETAKQSVYKKLNHAELKNLSEDQKKDFINKKWNSLSQNEKDSYKKNVFSSMTDEEKVSYYHENTTDKVKQEIKGKIAEQKLQKKHDENFLEYQKTIDSATPTKVSRLVEKARELQSSSTVASKVANATMNANKVIFGENAGKEMASSLKKMFEPIGNFASIAFKQMSGNFTKGADGALSEWQSAAIGKSGKAAPSAEKKKTPEPPKQMEQVNQPAEPTPSKRSGPIKLDDSSISKLGQIIGDKINSISNNNGQQ